MPAYNIRDDESNLSTLRDRAESGEKVVIARHGKPVAKLVPVSRGKRMLGSMIGLITAQSGWDAPISGEEAEGEFGL